MAIGAFFSTFINMFNDSCSVHRRFSHAGAVRGTSGFNYKGGRGHSAASPSTRD